LYERAHLPGDFAPGFRLSKLDLFVLIVGAVAAVVLGLQTWWLGFVIAFTVLHFFLFCNVFRIARSLELAWAAAFVGLSAGTIVAGVPGWPITVAATLVVTVVVIALEAAKPSYHGIWWSRINPKLPDWWAARRSDSTA
jgi:hypothetical protein